MTRPFEELPDLSAEARAHLSEQGVEDCDALLANARTPERRSQLAKAGVLEEGQLRRQASLASMLRVPGIGGAEAAALFANGITGVDSLRRQDPERLREILSGAGVVGLTAPSEGDIGAWIVASAELDEPLEEAPSDEQAAVGGEAEWVDGVLRSLLADGDAPGEDDPIVAIEGFLQKNAQLLGLDRVSVGEPVDRRGRASVVRCLEQLVDGVPLVGAELVIMAAPGRGVLSVQNELDLQTWSTDTSQATHPEDQAKQRILNVVRKHFQDAELEDTRLTWRRHMSRSSLPNALGEAKPALEAVGKAADARLHRAYEATVRSEGHDFRVVLDAVSGEVLDIVSLNHSAETTALGQVYMPDPATQSGTDLSPASDAAVLNQYRREVELILFAAGVGEPLRLQGEWVRCVNWDPPHTDQPSADERFFFDATEPRFLSVNAYYWLDTFIRLVRSYGVEEYQTGIAAKTHKYVEIDPQAFSNNDNSDCASTRDPIRIRFGGGRVPDAADLGVVVHEYVHALVRLCGTDLGGNYGLEHAFCDAMPAIFRDRYNEGRHKRTKTFPWDNVGDFWSTERTLDRSERFDDAGFSSYNTTLRNSMLGTAFWQCYAGMGGDDANPTVRQQASDQMLKSLMEALVATPSSNIDNTNRTKARALATSVIAADLALTGGTNRAAMRAAFVAQGIL